MRKFFRLYGQLLLFPLLFIPYHLLNSAVIVKWLGCGCPQIDEFGNLVPNSFNANDFTRLFWTGIALIVLLLSFFAMKYLHKRYWKVLYILSILFISLFFIYFFSIFMQWN